MTRWSILTCAILALPACDALFQINTVKADDASGDGGTRDSGSGLSDAADCTLVGKYGGTDAAPAGMFSVCIADAEVPAMNPAVLVNTATDCTRTMMSPGGTDVCVVVVPDDAVIAQLIVTGPRPLLIASRVAIALSGRLDLYASATPCASGDGAASASGGMGGAGGSFHNLGGLGGANLANAMGGMPGPGVVLPADLEFGCAGGAGGPISAAAGASFAHGGAAGGALYLIAGQRIKLLDTAVINVSGLGGEAGPSPGTIGAVGGGGGGGGTGGMIVLDTPLLAAVGSGPLLLANGGGGGAGGGSVAVVSTGGSRSVSLQPGTGGTASASGHGGDGGAGGDGTMGGAGSPAAAANAGGGGGGGAAGWIYYYTRQVLPAVNSSPPMVVGP